MATFLNLTTELLDDPAAKAAFGADPARFLASRGLADLSPRDVTEAIGFAADALDPSVAVHLGAASTPGPEGIGDDDGGLGPLRRLAELDLDAVAPLDLAPAIEPPEDPALTALFSGPDPAGFLGPEPSESHDIADSDIDPARTGIDAGDPPPEVTADDLGSTDMPAVTSAEGGVAANFGEGAPDAPAPEADQPPAPQDGPGGFGGPFDDPAAFDEPALGAESEPLAPESASAVEAESESFDETDLDPRDVSELDDLE